MKKSKVNPFDYHEKYRLPVIITQRDIEMERIYLNFYNDQLFEELKTIWGPLRISNWDMGRLADSWIKMNRVAINWKVQVVKVTPHEIKSFCKPPVTKRTLA